METWIYIVCVMILVIIIAVLAEIWKEIHQFQITRYHLTSDKLRKHENPLKIVFLSDLHNHVYGKENEELLEAIRQEKPDYILIGGDMLIGRKQKFSYKKAVDFVKRLPEIAPVYYSNGNHEQRLHEWPEYYGDSYEEYKSLLEQSGINWLENRSVELSWKQENITVTGVEIPIECYRKRRRFWVQIFDLEERVGNGMKENFHILMAHHPDYAMRYNEWGADLTLSGHLHGGVVRLPALGGVISPQLGLFPKYSGGCYDLDGGKIIVSRGLGTHTINIRFWNPAELVSIQINGEL